MELLLGWASSGLVAGGEVAKLESCSIAVSIVCATIAISIVCATPLCCPLAVPPCSSRQHLPFSMMNVFPAAPHRKDFLRLFSFLLVGSPNLQIALDMFYFSHFVWLLPPRNHCVITEFSVQIKNCIYIPSQLFGVLSLFFLFVFVLWRHHTSPCSGYCSELLCLLPLRRCAHGSVADNIRRFKS